MSFDLHVHTNASDGTETPVQVVARAFKTGLEGLAITDHDTLDGLATAMSFGRSMSVEVIPGIELSTEKNGVEIHILGYLVSRQCQVLLDRLRLLRMHRKRRALKIIDKLRELGISITPGQVLASAGKSALGRPHIARVLQELGFVGSLTEAFDRYLGRGCPAYVPRFKLFPAKAVESIILAGGVPVLAHPGLGSCDEFIPELVKAGLKGLEVYYPAHSTRQVEHYLGLCAKYGLIPTGGSDYHGLEHKDHAQMAAKTVAFPTVQKLKDAASRLRDSGIY